jgi:hypothetical protein
MYAYCALTWAMMQLLESELGDVSALSYQSGLLFGAQTSARATLAFKKVSAGAWQGGI